MNSQTSVRENFWQLPKSEWTDAEWADMQCALNDAAVDSFRMD